MEKYLEKIEKMDTTKILWNVPEQKQGSVAVIGGNSQSFRTAIKTAEFLTANYPIKEVRLVLPDALKNKLPNLPNLVFLSSTESGSFSDSAELSASFNMSDYNIIIGDLSKNAITKKALADTLSLTEKPLIITRDAVDLATEINADRWLMNPEIIIFASNMQLQKLFHAVYYPKMLTMSQSLVQLADALHKFTLSYPISLITLHGGQVIIVKNGLVKVLPLENTSYSPLTLWSGEAAAKIAALNLFNPNNFLDATTTGLLS